MRIGLFLLLIISLPSSYAADVRYVTDNLKLSVRAGTTTGHKIVQMVPSGARVEILKTAPGGYSKIRTSRGKQGWILSRYLMDQPSARNRVAAAETEAAQLRQENQQLKAELASLRDTSNNASARNVELSQREQELSRQLGEIRRVSAGAIEMAEQNKVLKRELLQKEKDIQTLAQETATMSKRSDQQWFMIGAIVVLVSIFLGHLLPRMRLRKGSNLDSF